MRSRRIKRLRILLLGILLGIFLSFGTAPTQAADPSLNVPRFGSYPNWYGESYGSYKATASRSTTDPQKVTIKVVVTETIYGSRAALSYRDAWLASDEAGTNVSKGETTSGTTETYTVTKSISNWNDGTYTDTICFCVEDSLSRIAKSSFTVAYPAKSTTVTFHSNCTDADSTFTTQTFLHKATQDGRFEGTITRDGYLFIGWCENADGKDTLYSMNSNVTNHWIENHESVDLYAIWQKVELKFEDQTLTGTYDDAAAQQLSFIGASNGSGSYIYTIAQQAENFFSLSDKVLTVRKGTPAGNYEVKITATDTQYDGVEQTATMTVVIEKADGILLISDQNQGTGVTDLAGQAVSFPDGKKVYVVKSHGGTITAKAADARLADVSVSNGVITVIPKKASPDKELLITVTCQATENYEAKDVTCHLTILKGTLRISVEDFAGNYDGNFHSGTIHCTPEPDEMQFGTSPNSYTTASQPFYCEIGDYTIYFRYAKENYEDYEGQFRVSIYAVNEGNYGGLVGYMEDSVMTNSFTTASVGTTQSTATTPVMGGLIGFARNSTLSDSYAANPVIALNEVNKSFFIGNVVGKEENTSGTNVRYLGYLGAIGGNARDVKNYQAVKRSELTSTARQFSNTYAYATVLKSSAYPYRNDTDLTEFWGDWPSGYTYVRAALVPYWVSEDNRIIAANGWSVDEAIEEKVLVRNDAFWQKEGSFYYYINRTDINPQDLVKSFDQNAYAKTYTDYTKQIKTQYPSYQVPMEYISADLKYKGLPFEQAVWNLKFENNSWTDTR